MTAREIDIHTLPSMLTALRLPSFHKLWAEIATRADNEGWPAARFLAVLAEYELAERDMRRIRRHLNEAQLPVREITPSQIVGIRHEIFGFVRGLIAFGKIVILNDLQKLGCKEGLVSDVRDGLHIAVAEPARSHFF